MWYKIDTDKVPGPTVAVNLAQAVRILAPSMSEAGYTYLVAEFVKPAPTQIPFARFDSREEAENAMRLLAIRML